MAFVGLAVASEVDDTSEANLSEIMVVVDEDAGTVTIALPVDGELPECSDDESDPAEPVETDDEGQETDDDGHSVTYAPGDCISLTIDHPSGKVHHGAVVSTVAKSLHPSMLDGIKKGEIMRWVAKGGGDRQRDDDGDEDDADKPKKDSELSSGKSNRGNGNGNGRGNSRSNPGNGRGPKR